MVDQNVHVEGIDLAGVEASASVGHVLKQRSQLPLVVRADHLASHRRRERSQHEPGCPDRHSR